MMLVRLTSCEFVIVHRKLIVRHAENAKGTTLGISLPVVMISGQANIEMAVRATRLGAVDFLEKPLSTDKLLLTVDNVLKLKRLEDEKRKLSTTLKP